MKMAFVINLS